MNKENKNRLELGIKMLALAIYLILTIAICSYVSSAPCIAKAAKGFTVVLFFANLGSITYLGWSAYRKYGNVLAILFPKLKERMK